MPVKGGKNLLIWARDLNRPVLDSHPVQHSALHQTLPAAPASPAVHCIVTTNSLSGHSVLIRAQVE